MKRIILIFSLFFLIIFTSITKNSTKKIENKIKDLKKNIRILEDRQEMVLLEFNYLSSPKKLMEYQYKYFEKELGEIDIINLKKIYIKNDQLIVGKFLFVEESNDKDK